MAKKRIVYRALGITVKLLRITADYIEKLKNTYKFEKDVKERVKRIGGGYRGTKKEYVDTVLAYWKKYGQKPKRVWYALYCDGMDRYDPRFITSPMWKNIIIPYFNNKKRWLLGIREHTVLF